MPATLFASASAGHAMGTPAPEGPVYEAVVLHLLHRRLIRCLRRANRFCLFFASIIVIIEQRAYELLLTPLTAAQWYSETE